MLLILKTWPFFYGKKIHQTFFIEEPEAHLFPVSQKQIISLIATIYNAVGHSFFITTHSPYILTAINNLVVGQDAYDKANGDTNKLKKLEKVLSTDELIRLEDVSAYTLNKGKLESIIDMENRLIGANLLDAVSDEFDAAFSVATEILYGAE
jgi:predicted ATP-binding protein involved in virulence